MGTYTDLAKLIRPKQPPQAVPVSPAENVAEIPSPPSQVDDPAVVVSSLPIVQPTHVENARVQESKNASTPPSKITSILSSKNARMQDFVAAFLAMKNTKNTNFRYPPELLEKIEDLEYEVKKRTGKKLKTTDILVCAVGYLIWDYEQHGADSIVERLLVEQNA
jgi:hypothetical protein